MKKTQKHAEGILKLRLNILILLMFLYGFSVQGQLTFQSNFESGCTPLGVIISVTSPSAATISSYAWSITYPNGTVQTASSPQYIAILSVAGSYDVSLTINGNETTTINDYITVFGNPTANFSVDDEEGCFPLCINFSDLSTGANGAQIVEWSWDFGNGSTSSSQNPTYCYGAVGTYSPVFSIEDEHGCYDDITMPGLIQVSDDFPVVDFTVSSQLDCNPPVLINMTNSSVGYSDLTSEWDFGDGSSVTLAGASPTSHNYTSTGNFDVCLTVTDEIGCQDQECIPVEIFDTAVADFSVGDIVVCENELVNFSDLTQPVPPLVQWDFNGDGIVDSTNPNPVFSYPQAGFYSPEIIVVYSSQCTDTLSGNITIEVTEGIDVIFSADTTQSCQTPFDVAFSNSSTGAGILQYEWYINGSLASTSSSFSNTFNNFGNYDIELEVSNQFGCNNSLTLDNYIQLQAPQISFTHDQSVCVGEVVSLTSINVNSFDPIVTWEWDFDGDGSVDFTGPDPDYVYTAPGPYTISVNVVTQNGCTASYTSPSDITVQSAVDTGFSASTTYTCAGEQIEFCVAEQPGNTYSWNFGDDTGWETFPYFENCVLHDYSDTGYFDVTLSVFNGACSMTVTVEDFIYIEPPVALYTFDLDCNNLLTVQFHDESILADSLIWDFGDGSPLVIDETDPIHTFPGAGTYDVSLTAISDTIGCPDVKMDIVVLEPPDPTCVFTPTSGCPPLMVDIVNNTYNVDWLVEVSNGDTITVHWNDTLNKWQVTYEHDGITQNFLYSANIDFWPTLSFENAGDFDITVTSTNAAGCSETIFYDDIIHVSANPDFASFTLDVVNSCDSVHIGFIADATNIETYSWTLSDGTILNDANPYHTFLPPYDPNVQLWATLSAVDSTGCSSTVTQEIDLVLPANPEFIVASDPSCENDLVQFVNYSTGDVQSYWWDFGDPNSGVDNNSTIENPTHIFNSNGTYTVCLTVENSAGCQSTFCNNDAVHIINPVVSFTYSSVINNCLYGVSFTNTTPGNIIISEWNFGDGQTGLGINAFHTYPIGVYDVSLFVVNEYGCFDTLVVPDILNYGDVIGPYSQVLDTANCTPFQVDFSAFNPTDTYFDYFWDFNDGNGDPSNVTQTTHIYTQTGVYCPSIIMTDPNGCPVLIQCVDSIVVQAFDLSFVSTGEICFGDSLEFSVSGATNYVWDDDTYVNTLSEGEYLIFPPDTTDLVVTGYFSDCVTTDTLHVLVNSLPIVNLTMTDEVCFNDAPIPLDGGSPNDLPGTYYVDGILSSQFDPSQTPGMSYLVEYEYTDTNTCVNRDTVMVMIHDLPVVNLDPFDPYCEDSTTIVLGGGMPAGGLYFINGIESTEFEPSTGDGTYPVTYSYTDSNNCTNTDVENIVIYPIPDVVLLYANVCLESEFQVNNESSIPSGEIIFSDWEFGPYGACSTFEPDPVLYLSIGDYNFSVNMISDMGCDSGIDTVVSVWARPVAAFAANDGCQYTTLAFQDESTIEEGNLESWIWEAEQQFFDNPDSLQYAFQQWGIQTVNLIVFSDHNCSDTTSHDIMVHPAPVIAISSVDNCLDELSELVSDMSIPQGTIDAQLWNLGDGWPELEDDDVEHFYPTAGTFDVTLQAWSDQGCSSLTQDSITIFPLPQINFTLSSSSLCDGQVMSYVDQSTIAYPFEVVAWQWSLDNVYFSTDSSGLIVPPVVGDFDLSLSVMSNAGCVSDSLLGDYIHILPKPDAGFLADPLEVLAWDPVVNVVDTSSSDVIQWEYDFGDSSTGYNPDDTHNYPGWGGYMITQVVTNEFGCKDTAYQAIEVKPDILIYVPNCFTPDGDGINEVFKPEMSGFFASDYEFSIFNRWGEIIFTTGDPNEGWVGNVRGGELFTPDGVYTWQVNLRPTHDAAIRTYSGHVYMVR